jgi:hypothetical protein
MPVTQVRSKQQFLVTDNVSFQDLYRLTNLVNPTNAQDAATKAYVDSVKQALDIKDSVRVATTGAESYTIVGGAVTQITGTTIDGVTIALNDRILIKNAPAATGAGAGAGSANTSNPANGIYVVTTASPNIIVQRATDADVSTEVTAGLFVFVAEGTAGADNGYVLTTNDAITLNTTGLTFTQFSGAGQIDAGAGLTKTGNTINVGTASTARIVVNANDIDLATVAGLTAGTFTKVTVDSYGRVTLGAQATTGDISESGNLYFTNARAQAAITGGASTIVTANLTVSRALISDGSGKVAVSTVSSTELGHLVGVTSAIQTQLDNKQPLDGDLTAIAALAGTSGLLRKTAANTWELDTNTYLTAASGVTTFSGGTTGLTPGSATSGAITLAGTLALANGGTGATTAAAARTNLGATTVGSNLFTLTNPSAISFLRVNADNSVSALNAADFRTAIGAGTGNGSVTSVAVSGGTTGLTTSGGPITGAGTITLAGTLAVGNGGTGLNTTPANGQLLIGNGSGYTLAGLTAGSGIVINPGAGTISISTTALSATNFVTREVPTGSVNGTNPTFTLANTPTVGTEEIYVNGILQNGGSNDYAISGATITFQTGAIPQNGDVVLVNYRK